MKTWLLFSTLLGLGACATDTTCGDGTTKVGNICEGNGGGSGSGNTTTCGAGTHLDGTTCVPDGAPAGGTPTITKLDPASAGVSGSGLFTLTGTNFAGSDISDLHVYFGPTTMNCEAVVGAATATTIAGEVPPACDLNVTVTVQTNKGMATTPFHYDAIFAADGDAGGVTGQAGDIYIIDPYNQRFSDLGPVQDQTGYNYGVAGLAFSNGKLFAVSTGDSLAGDLLDGASSLLTIDLAGNGATWIAETKDATHHPFIVTDIKFNGSTLYGLAYAGSATTSLPVNKRQFVVTIDPTTGVVAKVGTGQLQTTTTGGLAVDSTGAVFAATTAAGSLDSLDMVTGAHTSMLTLDYFVNAPVSAMTYFGPSLLAVIDNGSYGVQVGNTIDWSGETLALIDPTADPNTAYYVNPLFEMPNRGSYKAMVDAVVVPPADFSFGTATGRLVHASWQGLQAASGAATTSHALQLAR